jgi:hypothetical protein
MDNAEASYSVSSWDENTIIDIGEGAKITVAKIGLAYSGDIEGVSKVEYVMTYSTDGTASFVGFEQIVGKIAGKVGSFVIQHIGKFEKGVARSELKIIPGAGSGELKGLDGIGNYSVEENGVGKVTMQFSIAN